MFYITTEVNGNILFFAGFDLDRVPHFFPSFEMGIPHSKRWVVEEAAEEIAEEYSGILVIRYYEGEEA